MREKRRLKNYTGSSSMSAELDVLDPFTSKANDPPTQGQLEMAVKLDVDLSGKNPGSAAHVLSKALRNLAIQLVTKHKIVPGMMCAHEGKNPSVIKKVGGAPPYYEGKGAIVLITFQKSGISPPRWVHPRWLSDFSLPKKEGRRKVDTL